MGKDKHTFKEIEKNMEQVTTVRIEFLNCCKIVQELKEHFKLLKEAMLPFCDNPAVGLTAAYQPFLSFRAKESGEIYTVTSAVQFFDTLRDISTFKELNK